LTGTSKTEVGILGATGTVGQQFVALLADHPWFRVTWLAASERSAGHRYGELPWRMTVPLPDDMAAKKIETIKPGCGPKLVFSALDSSAAGEMEAAFAAAGHIVVSNTRAHRMHALVPLLVAEINPQHLGLLPLQRQECGWLGYLVTNPNCSTVFLALALAALREFSPERVVVTTLQALSGAGYPGVPSLDAVGNVIPFIEGEEGKIETETRKVLGRFTGGAIEPHPVTISAQVNRVPVLNGHLETIALSLREILSIQEIKAAFSEYAGSPQMLELPSAPRRPLVYMEEQDRPQPRLDVERHEGMAVFVGRLRPCPVMGHKFVVLGHNLIRGAAGTAILNAELLCSQALV
jgi:aspartate-semialdehyde dehydrogenase